MRIGCGIGVKAIAVGFDFFDHALEITRINRERERERDLIQFFNIKYANSTNCLPHKYFSLMS